MLDVVVIGAGLRGGLAYGRFAEEVGIRFVAVVDPLATRREAFGAAYDVPVDRRFASVGEWLAADGAPFAGAAIVATPDDQHVEPAVAALEAGCHVLLEKPMAQTEAACRHLIEVAERVDRQLHVCHVMRYAPFFRAVKEVVASGRLGRLVTVEHRENVDALHMAHSYVRGAYRREDESNPMLLAKSCHDLDILLWILDEPIVRVSSFGSLLHFRPESVGPEVPDRCTDGCPHLSTCLFAAPRLYAPTPAEAAGATGATDIRFLTSIFPLSDPPTFDQPSRLAALATSPYGRCAYRCDNDVVDHQVLAMETASGTTVSFTMHGHSHEEGRTMRYDGTLATLRGSWTEASELTLHPHGTGEVEVIDAGPRTELDHGGGDLGVLQAFVASLDPSFDGPPGVSGLATSAADSLPSHQLAWAAERARRNGTVEPIP